MSEKLAKYKFKVSWLLPCENWFSKRTKTPISQLSLVFVISELGQSWILAKQLPLAGLKHLRSTFYLWADTFWVFIRLRVGWLCWGLTSQSTIFQSCRDGAIASWVINQYFRGVKCLAQGHNTAEVGLEPRTSRSGVRYSTTEPPRSP